MMSTPGIFVFITSIFKYYYFTSTRLACILVMRVESDSFWYTVKMCKVNIIVFHTTYHILDRRIYLSFRRYSQLYIDVIQTHYQE